MREATDKGVRLLWAGHGTYAELELYVAWTIGFHVQLCRQGIARTSNMTLSGSDDGCPFLYTKEMILE